MMTKNMTDQESAFDLAAKHLNPKWVKVLRILGLDQEFVRGKGSYLFDEQGDKYLDFHTGEGVTSLGHNNDRVNDALRSALEQEMCSGVQIHYHSLSGRLAETLSDLTDGRLPYVFFGNSGSEVVEAAIKMCRRTTGRGKIVSCSEAFHGLTMGALSLAGEDYFKEGFGPLLPGCSQVPFDDLDALEIALANKDVAAFFVEPIQGRTVRVPSQDYLRGAQELCKKYGSLFVADEIQTGLGRTGKMFACEHWGLEPDVLLLAKALSGGAMPVGAMIYSKEIYQRTFTSLRKSYVHHSTFGRNNLAMVAGLAVIDEIRRRDLLDNANDLGDLALKHMTALKEKYEMVHDVRGMGLMFAIELGSPKSLRLKLQWKAISAMGPGLFAQIVVRPLLTKHRIISMVSGENDVIKFLPPINMSQEEMMSFLEALESVIARIHESSSSVWGELMDIGKSSIGW